MQRRQRSAGAVAKVAPYHLGMSTMGDLPDRPTFYRDNRQTTCVDTYGISRGSAVNSRKDYCLNNQYHPFCYIDGRVVMIGF